MTTHRPPDRSPACIDPEDLGRILALDPAADARRHLESCPRCRALLASYRTFVEPDAVPLGADVAAAEAQMRARLDEALAEEGTFSTPPAFSQTSPGWWTLLRGGLRPAWSFATILLVLGAVLVLRQIGTFDEHEIRLRGEEAASGDLSLVLYPPRPQPDGSIELSWAPVVGADSYEVRIYTPDLDLVSRHAAGTRTTYRLDTGHVRSLDLDTLLWRVIARRQGSDLATSPARSIDLH